MMAQALIFYFLAGITLFSSIMVISVKNPVHSVLFLILTFFNSAGLFLLVGAEFLAMILVIVYVGAVAVLFLFVVMMLNVNYSELRSGILQYLPVGLVIGSILIIEMVIVMGSWVIKPEALEVVLAPISVSNLNNNTSALGEILYTENIYLFQLAGMILLVAMIGAIVLTFSTKPGVKRQKVLNQLLRDKKDSVRLEDLKSNEGININEFKS